MNRQAAFQVVRFVLGALLGAIGLYVLGVDFSTIGFLRGIGGLFLIAVGTGIMPPNLFGRS